MNLKEKEDAIETSFHLWWYQIMFIQLGVLIISPHVNPCNLHKKTKTALDKSSYSRYVLFSKSDSIQILSNQGFWKKAAPTSTSDYIMV